MGRNRPEIWFTLAHKSARLCRAIVYRCRLLLWLRQPTRFAAAHAGQHDQASSGWISRVHGHGRLFSEVVSAISGVALVAAGGKVVFPSACSFTGSGPHPIPLPVGEGSRRAATAGEGILVE